MGDWLDGEWKQKSPFCSCRVSVSAFPHNKQRHPLKTENPKYTHTNMHTHKLQQTTVLYCVFSMEGSASAGQHADGLSVIG